MVAALDDAAVFQHHDDVGVFDGRQPVSDDARLKKITLTDRGETMRREMIEGRKRMEAKLTAGFSSEELQNLRDYLRRMKENMKR